MIQWLGITLVDIGHARAVLTAWTNAPGNPKPLPSYGLNFLSPTWTQDDGILLHAFATWWNGSGYGNIALGQGSPLQAELTDAHLSALDKWFAGAVPLPPAVDVPAGKTLLVLWGKTDGQGLVPADYGVLPQDLPASPWTKRDGQALMAFGKWSKPPISGSTFTTEYSIALKKWLIEQMSKGPGGWVAPPAAPPAQKTPQSPQTLPPVPGQQPPAPPPALVAKPKDSTALYVLGGVLVAVVGGLWLWMARTPRAALPPGPQDNPARKTKRKRSPVRARAPTPPRDMPRAPNDPVLPLEVGGGWIAVTQEQSDGRWAVFLVDTRSESWRTEGSGSVIGSHGKPVYEIAGDANTALDKLERRAGRRLSELYANPRRAA